MMNLPTEAIFLFPDGKQVSIRLNVCDITYVRDPSEVHIELRGIIDHNASPVVSAAVTTGEAHDAGGGMWALRCPRCGDFAEAHECDGSRVRPTPVVVEAPVVVPELTHVWP